MDIIPSQDLPPRVLGPPTIVTGTGFFESFLPLMAILGDIIDLHHRRHHPRLGMVDDSQSVAVISELLVNCEASIEKLERKTEPVENNAALCTPTTGLSVKEPVASYAALPPVTHASPPPTLPVPPPDTRAKDRSRRQLVTAYSTHILHVLHVLLHGKWDAISMLDDDDDWITSKRFNDCASHAIAASQAVSQILKYDPELTFMPYLFGIYLLHGSFILLLFADRMPRVGPNQSVELACETIVRAHEVCVVTLSTEFQASDTLVRISLVAGPGWLTAKRVEKLPQGTALDALQRAWLEPHGVGGAQGETESALAVSLDERRKGAGVVKPILRRRAQGLVVFFFSLILLHFRPF